MNDRFRFLILLVIFCLNGGRVCAQQSSLQSTPRPAAAHPEGLLLGMYFPETASWDDLNNDAVEQKWVPEISMEPQGRYLTFWISKTGDVVNIQAVEGLLVPRDSGFWHIGTRIVKADHDPQLNYDEQLWAAPVGEKPKMLDVDKAIDGTSVRLITYVGPEYAAYLFHWQGGAGGWEYVYPGVASLDNPSSAISLEKVLGPAAGLGYKRLAKSLDHMDAPPDDDGGCNCCEGRSDEWGILHAGDSWQAFARFQQGTSSSCAQGSEDHVLRTAIPKSLAAGGTLGQPWGALRSAVEAALKSEQGSVRHLFVSPKEDLAVAVSTNGLAVLGIENGHIRSVLKIQSFDAPSIPVMEQWSIGRFVASWDAAIQKERPATVPRHENP